MQRYTVDTVKTGAQISKLMELNHYDVKKVALEVDLDTNTIRQYIKGRSKPKIETLLMMKELFHLDKWDDLLIIDKGQETKNENIKK